ncbi:hypothetical protein [Kineosporia succinea]|uniref:Uncharacterized protein n=1 Tax=Kineosporia succinea TaxID=84632 RepID=A0ABT9P254_9ACTN|nr:hypothetical protein [Kineosporia succinea]MDP9826764.1 hypothetical protein [Kineosporia succinea]
MSRPTITTHLDTSATPAWLMNKVRTIADRAAAGNLRACPHLATTPTRCAAAWAPDHIACPTCFPLLDPQGAEDNTCDRCRREVDTLNLNLAFCGPLLYAYGLCDFCMTTIDLEAP